MLSRGIGKERERENKMEQKNTIYSLEILHQRPKQNGKRIREGTKKWDEWLGSNKKNV